MPSPTESQPGIGVRHRRPRKRQRSHDGNLQLLELSSSTYTNGGCDGPEPGADLSDVIVYTGEDIEVRLGELVNGLTVLETGSITGPLYAANIDPMRQVAGRHPHVQFAVLYTREAHPGGRRGPHEDLMDKLGAAATLVSQAGEWGTVLVDGTTVISTVACRVLRTQRWSSTARPGL